MVRIGAKRQDWDWAKYFLSVDVSRLLGLFVSLQADSLLLSLL